MDRFSDAHSICFCLLGWFVGWLDWIYFPLVTISLPFSPYFFLSFAFKATTSTKTQALMVFLSQLFIWIFLIRFFWQCPHNSLMRNQQRTTYQNEYVYSYTHTHHTQSKWKWKWKWIKINRDASRALSSCTVSRHTRKIEHSQSANNMCARRRQYISIFATNVVFLYFTSVSPSFFTLATRFFDSTYFLFFSLNFFVVVGDIFFFQINLLLNLWTSLFFLHLDLISFPFRLLFLLLLLLL